MSRDVVAEVISGYAALDRVDDLEGELAKQLKQLRAAQAAVAGLFDLIDMDEIHDDPEEAAENGCDECKCELAGYINAAMAGTDWQP